MKMAARSGNVEMFNTAMEAVLLRGKVNTTRTQAKDYGCR